MAKRLEFRTIGGSTPSILNKSDSKGQNMEHFGAVRVDTGVNADHFIALIQSLNLTTPDLIKPNAEELAGVLGFSPQALEAAVAHGDPERAIC